MADLFVDPSFFQNNGGGPVQSYTGNPEIDRELATMPEEERQAALAEITAPPTGEEIADMVSRKQAAGEVPNMSIEDYRLYKAYIKDKEVDIMESIGMGAEMVFNDLQRAAGAAWDDPVNNLAKLTPSVIEAFAQGTRGLYGMLAQSQDPNSTLFRVKNALSADGSDEQAEFQQFMEALDFNAKSTRLMTGKETIVMDKDLINPEMTQAMSYIADPTLFIPFGGIAAKGARLVGMSEGLAKAAARAEAIKSMVLGGAIKWGVGAPIEFVGGATRSVIDGALERGSRLIEAGTGLSAKELESTARLSGLGTVASGVAGFPVAGVTDVSQAYIGATAARGLGEAIGAVGEQMMKGPRGVRSYAAQALRESAGNLTPHAQNLLKVIDTFDPMFSYSGDIISGVSQGAAIGAGLGYLSGGQEGMAQGIGAGGMLGGTGAAFGRVVADTTGATRRERMRITDDLVLNGLKDINPQKYKDFMTLRAVAEAKGVDITGYIGGFDTLTPDLDTYFRTIEQHKAEIRARGFDPEKYDGSFIDESGRRLFSVQEFSRAEGYVVAKAKDGRIQLGINLDNLKKNTVPHEAFHAVFRSVLMEPEFQRRMTENVLGVFDKNGKMIEPPRVSKEDAVGFFNRYLGALYKGETLKEKQTLLNQALTEYYRDGQTTVMDTDGKTPFLASMAEEFGAYYFTQFIQGKPVDYLYLGGQYTGIRGLIESAKEGWIDYWEAKTKQQNPRFDINNPDGIDYAFKPKGGKRVRVSALDYMMRDLIRAAESTNRDGSVNLNRMSQGSRESFARANGLDGVLGEKKGVFRRPSARGGVDSVKVYNKTYGKEVHKAILAMPDQLRPRVDGDGNFVGPLSKEVLDQMVSTGFVSREMANKISLLQDMASGKMDSNIAEMGYIGWSMQTDVGPNPPRVYGDEVPYKRRKVLVYAVESKIGPQGMSFTAKTVDFKVIEARANNLWADPNVRRRWNDNRTEFVQDFFRYLENASKTQEQGRVPSAQLWAEDGAAKRDIMQQMAGMPRQNGDTFAHAPIAEVHEDILNSVMNLTVNRMTDVRVSGDKVNLNFEQANPFIRVNMKVAEMDFEDTPNGRVYTDKQSGFKFTEEKGRITAYDRNGERIGTYSSKEEAQRLTMRVYERQQRAMKDMAQTLEQESQRGLTFESKKEFIEKRISQVLENPEMLRNYISDFIKKSFPNVKEEDVVSFVDGITKINRRLRAAEEEAKAAYQKVTQARIRANEMVVDKFADDWDAEVLKVHGESGLKKYKQILKEVDVLRNEWANKYGEPLKVLHEESKKQIDALWVNYDEKISMKHKVETDDGLVDLIELYSIINKKIRNRQSDINNALNVAFGSMSGRRRLFNAEGDALAETVVKSTYSPVLQRQWEAQFPQTFRSGLLDKIKALHKQNPNLTHQGLLKKLLRDGSSGSRFWAEAEAIGLIKHLREQISPSTRIQKIRDAQGNWTGGIKEVAQPVGFKSAGVEKIVGGKLEPIDMVAIENFIKDNAITLTPEVGAREVNGMDTSRHTADGGKSSYNETAVRINQKYAHGVRGHYGSDSVVHHRSTLRTDVNGEPVRFVEEIQANNASEQRITEEDVKTAKAKIEIIDFLFEEGKKQGILTELADFSTIQDFLYSSNLFRSEMLKEYGVDKEEASKLISQKLSSDFLLKHKTELDRLQKYYSFNNPQEAAGYVIEQMLYSMMQRQHESAKNAREGYQITRESTLALIDTTNMGGGFRESESMWSFVADLFMTPDVLRFRKRVNAVSEKVKNFETSLSDKIKQVAKKDSVSFIDDSFKAGYMVRNPDFFKLRKIENQNTIQQFSVGQKKLPLEEISEWGAVAIKDIIRQATMNGEDKIALTHPDDTPAQVGMLEKARNEDYGRIFPDIIRKIVEPFGIEVRVRNELGEVAKQSPDVVAATNAKIDAQRKVLELFEKHKQGESPDVINPLAQLLARPVHEVAKDIEQWYKDSEKLVDNVNNPEFKKALVEATIKATEEARIWVDAKESNKIPASARLIDRAVSFELNDEIKKAVRQGDFFTAYKPAEDAGEQGGRTYTSRQLDRSFIGRYAAENPESTKDVTIRYEDRMDEDDRGYGKKIIYLTDNKTGKQIGSIKFELEDNSFYVNKDKSISGKFVQDISVKVSPEYQGRKYQHLLYSEMLERARSQGAIAFRQDIENELGLPMKSTNRIVGQDKSVIWTLADTELISPTQENFDRLMARSPEVIMRGLRHVPNVSHFGELDPNAWYKPAEDAGEQGGRRYTEKQFRSQLIGRVAANNPEKFKNIGIKVLGTKDSFEFYLYDKSYSSEDAIGMISTINKSGDNKSNIITQAYLKPEYRGNGYGKLLYSELGERLRSVGIENIEGTVVDLKNRPFSIRASVFGKDSTSRMVGTKDGIITRLDPNAWYKPAEDSEKAPVNWVKEGFNKEGYNAEVIWMKPSRFLNLAAKMGGIEEGTTSRAKINAIKKALQKQGGDMDMPYFSMSRTKSGELKVGGHEGRHRAVAIQELYGDKLIPVYLLMSEEMKQLNAGVYDWGVPESKKMKGKISSEFKALEENPFLNEAGTEKFKPAEDDVPVIRLSGKFKTSAKSNAEILGLGKVNPLNDKETIITSQGGLIGAIQARMMYDGKRGDYIRIDNLRSVSRGGGRAALEEVIKLADRETYEIELDAVPFESTVGKKMSSDELKNWYRKFGFVEGSQNTMTRSPNLQKQKPLRESFSPDEIKKNLRSLQSAIDRQSDIDKVPKSIRAGVGRLIQAVERQKREDIKGIPENVKEGFRALARAVDEQADMDKVPAAVRQGLRKLYESAQYEDLKPQRPMPKRTASEEQLATGLEALGRAVGVQGRVRRTTPPTAQARPKQQAPMAQPKAPEMAPTAPRSVDQPSSSAWRSWTYEKTAEGSVYKSAVGYMIMVHKGKFKLYNPYNALVGIYSDIESAKRRMLRDEPKQ